MCCMNKLYNTQKDFTIGISDFLKNSVPNIRKTQLNIIPYIMLGMITSKSCVASDIALQLKDEFSLVNFESVVKRIKRFFSNKLFEPYEFYDAIIKHVINNYKIKHKEKKVHIIFDHMFSHSNYTIFMISMRVGKQGIPLWFRCFRTRKGSGAYKEELINEGIRYVSSLFPSDYQLIFLADRWFNNVSTLKLIDSLGHIYRIRLRHNHRVLVHDKKEGHKIWKWVNELQTYQCHSTFYKDVIFTDERYVTNIVYAQTKNFDDPLIVITNGNYKNAIKDYNYRFGGIETIFKNQKSNGFDMEKVVNADIKYFTSMYSLVCLCTLFLNILGAEYSRNIKCYKNVHIPTHKNVKNHKIRVISLFKTGYFLFKIAYNSRTYVRIPYRFVLYDI